MKLHRLIDEKGNIYPPNNDSVDCHNDAFRFANDWKNGRPYLEVRTSGSTGTPKLIKHSRQNAIVSARITHEFFKFQSGINALLALPTQFIAGKMMVVRSIENGWNLYSADPSGNPLATLAMKMDFVALTPFQLQRVIDETPDKLEMVANLLLGGGELSTKQRAFLKKSLCQSYLSYGMSETLTHVAMQEVKTTSDESFFNGLPGFSFSADARSCLVIEASHLAERVVTNDIVEMLGPTSFRWISRFDNVVNSGGLKIIPEELEKKVAHLMPGAFYFTSAPDEVLGSRLVLCIEGSEVDAESLRNDLAGVLERKYLPKQIVVEETFDRTPTDKIIRKKF